MVSCSICLDLSTCDEEIPWSALVQGVAGGCQSCSLIRDGIVNVIDEQIPIDKLQLVLDVSLFVYVLGKEAKLLFVLEFYTLQGKLSALWTLF